MTATAEIRTPDESSVGGFRTRKVTVYPQPCATYEMLINAGGFTQVPGEVERYWYPKTPNFCYLILPQIFTMVEDLRWSTGGEGYAEKKFLGLGLTPVFTDELLLFWASFQMENFSGTISTIMPEQEIARVKDALRFPAIISDGNWREFAFRTVDQLPHNTWLVGRTPLAQTGL